MYRNPVESRAKRIAGVGDAVFAATPTAVGILGLIQGDIAAIQQPVSEGVPACAALAHLWAVVSLACGMGLLTRRTDATGAGVLLVYLRLRGLAFQVRHSFRTPTVEVSCESRRESAVIMASVCVAVDSRRGSPRLAMGKRQRRRFLSASSSSMNATARRRCGITMVPPTTSATLMASTISSLLQPDAMHWPMW